MAESGKERDSGLITPGALGTYSGLSMAVMVVTNGIHSAFGFDQKWLALAVALIVALIATMLRNRPSLVNIVYAVLNAFLIFTTAAGINSIGTAAQSAATRRVPEMRSTAMRHEQPEMRYLRPGGEPERGVVESDEQPGERGFFGNWFSG